MTGPLVTAEEAAALMDDTPSTTGDFSFRRPPAFVGPREAAFDRVAESLAAAIGKRFSRLLRGEVGVRWTGRSEKLPDQPPEGALLFRLPAPTGDAGLLLTAGIVPILADLLLGAPKPAGERTLTALERRVLRPMAQSVQESCAEVGVALGDPVLVEADAADRTGSNEETCPAVILEGQIEMGETTGGFDLILPLFTARRFVAEKIVTAPRISPGRLMGLGTTVAVEIRGGTLRYGELRTLKVGDVVRLDTDPQDVLPVTLNGKSAGTARLVGNGGQRSVVLDAVLMVISPDDEGGKE